MCAVVLRDHMLVGMMMMMILHQMGILPPPLSCPYFSIPVVDDDDDITPLIPIDALAGPTHLAHWTHLAHTSRKPFILNVIDGRVQSGDSCQCA
jgi:hypothetical protein